LRNLNDLKSAWAVYDERYSDPRKFMLTIRALAKTAGVPMYKVAQRMGTSAAALSRWGRGVSQPTVGTMIRIDKALYSILEDLAELEEGL
jgi:transcriptional regulator with XRE-family HTH domain